MSQPSCRSCAHFEDDPRALEDALPGLTILSSAFGSVRGDAGLCAICDRFMEPVSANTCLHYRPRQASNADATGAG
jgi:hypothetical protein